MKLQVETFAALADRLGEHTFTVELAEGATVADALRRIEQERPIVRELREQLAFAVNYAYVDRSHVLREGDSLALIPPVSGG